MSLKVLRELVERLHEHRLAVAGTDTQRTLARRFEPHAGRTLPEGMQWCGRDMPGGAAARRRLRQQARERAKGMP